MIVVSNTTPLNYLILIDAIHVLPGLFLTVHTTQTVIDELLHEKAPLMVRSWAIASPSWLIIHPSELIPVSMSALDAGEASALLLAQALNADALLIDERKGVAVAGNHNQHIIRTLALLEYAAQREMLDFPLVIERLAKTSFRIPRFYLDEALRRMER